ncbi:MAG: PAS domain S-box protein [Caldilineaceae bacterium]
MVVIVGAVGSRQALEMFFRNLPTDSGLAFIVAVRLGRQQIDRLPALLEKRTDMPVLVAADAMRPQADHIYIVPAGAQGVIAHGELQLTALVDESGQAAEGPLDALLFSLGEYAGPEATAILLSGAGADGVAGVERICQGGGIAFVQDPEEAAHGALPRRAVAACPAAIVTTAGDIARQLVQARGDLADIPGIPQEPTTFDDVYQQILQHIAMHTAHDLSHYKISTLYRRVARRMAVAGYSNLNQYVELLHGSPAAAQALFQDTLVSVTSFFRDPDAFEMLERDCIPQLFAEKERADFVRVWVAGCATGQEPYSVAMQLAEYAAQVSEPPRFQVFATDLDENAIAVARRGIYPTAVAQEMTPARLERFFIQTGDDYQVKPEIREHVLFAVHDLLRDPPFSRLDLVVCRNVLIYFNREAQERLFATFHYALESRGYLFLGTSESADAAPDLFDVLDKYCHLYQRRDVTSVPQRHLPAIASSTWELRKVVANRSTQAAAAHTLEELYTKWSLRVHTPPRLLVNANYEITHLFGDVSRYLQEPQGAVTQNILQRIQPELRLDLRTALYRAFNKGDRSISRGLHIDLGETVHLIHLHVGPVAEQGFPEGYVEVVFVAAEGADVLELAVTDGAIETDMVLVMRMEEELMRTREHLQVMIAEYEESGQELKTSNEELQSINEELKSTTEELETSKEELQSMNEELVTVNSDLTNKVEELNRANSDLLNFIASTDVGAIFLDDRLRISRFTPRATDLFNLIDADQGRPFDHVTHRIRHTNLAELAARVHHTSERIEATVQDNGDRWYELRLFPYRTVKNEIQGVVITFFDISDLKRAESEERQRRQQQVLAALSRQALVGTDLEMLFAETTKQVAEVLDVEFCKVLQLQADKESLLLLAGVGWQDELIGQATVPADTASQAGYTLHSQSPVVVRNMESETRFHGPALLLDHQVQSGMSVTIHGPSGPFGVLGAHSREARHFATYDVDFLQSAANLLAVAIERQQGAAELRARESALRRYVDMIEASYDAIIVWDPQTGIEFWNHGAEELYGYTVDEALGRTTHELLATKHPQPVADIMADLQKASAWEGELVHKTKAGHTIYVSTRHQLMVDDDGDQLILEINRDITPQKEAQFARRRHMNELEAIYNTAPVGLCVMDRELRYVRVNARLAEMNGLPVADHIGRTGRELFPDLAAKTEEALQRVLATGEPVIRTELTGEIPSQPGVQHTWIESWFPLRDANGEVFAVNIVIEEITERKQMELDLEQSNAILRGILESSRDAIFVRDLNGYYLLVNAAAAEQVAMSQAELIGKNYRELFPADAAAIENDDRPILEHGHSQSSENLTQHAGVTRYWNTLKMPLRAANGAMLGIISSARDMTERRRAEEELRRTHDVLALAQRVSQSGVWDWDIMRNKTYWSPEFYALYGLPLETAPTLETWLAAIHPHDRPRVEMRLREVLEGYDDWNEEYRIVHPLRGERWLLAVGRVSSDDDGQPLRFTGLNLDITERKEIDAQLRYQAHLLENVQDAVISTDLEYRIRSWNAGAEQLYGWSAAEAIGQQVGQMLRTEFANSDADGERASAELQMQGHWRGEVIQHTKHGEPVNISNITALVRDEAGTPTGTVAINRNITERKRAESRVHFLVQASTILASSLDYVATLENVAQAAVPNIADWCSIDLINEEGTIESAALMHSDPAKVQWAQELRERYPVDPNAPAGAPNVIRTGKAEFYPEITDEMLEAAAKSAEELTLLRSVGYRSVMVAPLSLHDRVLGAISLVSTESQRLFTEADLHMAEDLGRRAAVAIEHARLYQNLRERQVELRQSERRFRSAFEQAAVGMAHLDLQGRYLRVNERLCDILGYTRHDLLQKTFAEITHPADLHADETQMARQLAGELLIHSMEKRYLRGDGTYVWTTMTASIVHDEAGVAQYGLVVVEDISARKRADAALRRSEVQFRAVQQATPDGYMIFEAMHDETGAIVDFLWLYTNPAAEQITGRSHEYLLGKRLLVEMPGNRTEGLFDAYVQVVETGEVWQREFQYAHEGFNHWFRTTAAKAGDGIAVAFTDITANKQIEKALAESERRFRSTFEQAAVGMAHTDPDGYYVQVNERLCEIVGYPRAELLQKRFIDLVHPDEQERSAALNAQLISGERPSYAVEKRYIRRDGSLVWVHVTASSVYDEAGDIVYRLAVVEDISQRKAAEAALQELNATLEQRVLRRTDELERSNRELDQFAYVASHDLRAPLRAIDHLANWITEDVGNTLPPASQQHLTTLRGRIQRLEKLLEDLLAYSRVGRQLAAAEIVDSGHLVRQIVELLAPPAHFTVQVADDMPTLRTHRVPLELVLRNLIDNAIKHNDRIDGHVDGRIGVSAAEQGDWIEFTVQDNGPGIAPAFHERIFQIFQTLQPRDEVEGSGMGLAVVKKAVESMGGAIRVESAEGRGAVFRFTWPKQSAE